MFKQRHSIEREEWNQLIAALPNAHVLQTWEWGNIKSQFGWNPTYHYWTDENNNVVAAALILQRSSELPGFKTGIRIQYVPKGPLLDWENISLRRYVLSDLIEFARKNRAIFVKVDPDVQKGIGNPNQPDSEVTPLGREIEEELISLGWRFSNEQIQFRNTIVINLNKSEDELLARMKQKTRYNIRLSKRKGVNIQIGTIDDFEKLYDLYVETSGRDGFTIRAKDYYLKTWSILLQADMAEPLIAEVNGQEVAAVIIYHFAGKAWYFYGMSRNLHREKMPNYLLQWEAIRRAKEIGCTLYDLWGAPDSFEDSDRLSGVYRFKKGLGGIVVRHIGAWDYPVSPFLYWFYLRLIPIILRILKFRD